MKKARSQAREATIKLEANNDKIEVKRGEGEREEETDKKNERDKERERSKEITSSSKRGASQSFLLLMGSYSHCPPASSHCGHGSMEGRGEKFVTMEPTLIPHEHSSLLPPPSSQSSQSLPLPLLLPHTPSRPPLPLWTHTRFAASPSHLRNGAQVWLTGDDDMINLRELTLTRGEDDTSTHTYTHSKKVIGI